MLLKLFIILFFILNSPIIKAEYDLEIKSLLFFMKSQNKELINDSENLSNKYDVKRIDKCECIIKVKPKYGFINTFNINICDEIIQIN